MKKVSLLTICIAIFTFIALYSCKSPEEGIKNAMNKLENEVEEKTEEVAKDLTEAVDSTEVEETESTEESEN